MAVSVGHNAKITFCGVTTPVENVKVEHTGMAAVFGHNLPPPFTNCEVRIEHGLETVYGGTFHRYVPSMPKVTVNLECVLSADIGAERLDAAMRAFSEVMQGRPAPPKMEAVDNAKLDEGPIRLMDLAGVK